MKKIKGDFMEKIILTNDCIKKESKCLFLAELPDAIIIFILSFPVFCLSVYLFSKDSLLIKVLSVFMLVISAVLILIAIMFILKSTTLFLKILKGKIYIEKSILNNKQEEIPGRTRAIFSQYHPYSFYFSDYGEYKIIDHSYYKWSKVLVMNSERIFANAEIGDEFYLVISDGKKKEILFTYNTKLFEYKDII